MHEVVSCYTNSHYSYFDQPCWIIVYCYLCSITLSTTVMLVVVVVVVMVAVAGCSSSSSTQTLGGNSVCLKASEYNFGSDWYLFMLATITGVF